MGRCRCIPEVSNNVCACSIGADEGLSVTGSGTVDDPFVIAPVIDPDPTNQLTVGPDGLMVPPNYPLGVLAWTKIEAQSDGAEDTDIVILELDPVTPIGPDRYWKLWFHSAQVEGDIEEDVIIISAKEGAAYLNRVTQVIDHVNVEEDGVSITHLIIAPAETAHTYSIAIRRSAASSGLVAVGAGATFPAWLVLEDCGIVP